MPFFFAEPPHWNENCTRSAWKIESQKFYTSQIGKGRWGDVEMLFIEVKYYIITIFYFSLHDKLPYCKWLGNLTRVPVLHRKYCVQILIFSNKYAFRLVSVHIPRKMNLSIGFKTNPLAFLEVNDSASNPLNDFSLLHGFCGYLFDLQLVNLNKTLFLNTPNHSFNKQKDTFWTATFHRFAFSKSSISACSAMQNSSISIGPMFFFVQSYTHSIASIAWSPNPSLLSHPGFGSLFIINRLLQRVILHALTPFLLTKNTFSLKFLAVVMEDNHQPSNDMNGDPDSVLSNGATQDQIIPETPLDVSLADIANLPALPLSEVTTTFIPDPLVYAYTDPITTSTQPQSFQPSSSFEPSQNPAEMINSQMVPNPHDIQAIDNHLAHMEHFGLIIRLVDLSEPVTNATIISRLSEIWKGIKGEITVDELGNSWILFLFETRDARDVVWFNRPYHVQGKLLVVLEYFRKFDPLSFQLRFVDIWVRIPFLPFYLQTEQALTMIVEGNHVGYFLKVDDNSNIKNRRKFVRLCINISFPNPPKYVHFRHQDNSILSFEIWYEGFSAGCGCCGDVNHLFEEFFLHNLTPIGSQFNPVSNGQAAENARLTRLRLLNNLMANHAINPRPVRPPTIRKRLPATPGQRLIEGRQGRGVSGAPRPSVLASPPMQSSEMGLPPTSLEERAIIHSTQIIAHSSEMLANMHQLAEIISNPSYVPGKETNAKNAELIVMEGMNEPKKAKDDKDIDEDESPPKSRKGKEKVVDGGPPSAKKRKNSKNGGALKIHG